MIRLLAGCLTMLFCACRAIGTEGANTPFDAANRLYEEGNYNSAVKAYQEMLASGKASPALYFNLGNAWFKSGHLGQAIAAYRKAGQLAPRDRDITANLRFVRQQVQGPAWRPGAFARGAGWFTLNEWAAWASGCWWLCLLLLAARELKPSLAGRLKAPAGCAAAAALGLGVVLGWSVYQARACPAAVVVAKEAVARHGPLEESHETFRLHDGAEVLILDRKDDWAQISADNRQTGWVKRDLLEPI